MIDPHYIRTVRLINIEHHPTLGLISNCTEMRPYKGRFADEVVGITVNGAKNLISFTFFLLRTTPLILFCLIPAVRLNIGRRLGMHLFKLQVAMWEKIPDTDYSRPVCELNRAIDTVMDKTWQLRMQLNFKYTFLCFVEFDDHYRFIMQDLFGDLDKVNLEKNPKKELKRLLDLGISRTHFDGVRQKMKDFKRLLTLVPSRYLKFPVKVLLEVDLDKIRLDEDDLSWAEDKPYDFGGVPWKGREYSLSKGKNNDILNTMNNLSPEEIALFNKELFELCTKHGVEMQIKSDPQLIIIKKNEQAEPAKV